jgi:hypothetical protein
MSTFSSRPINCPHCGHPFVLWMKYLQHAKACAEAKQEELDRKWERDRRDRLPLGLKHAMLAIVAFGCLVATELF